MSDYDDHANVAFPFRGLYVTGGATYDRRSVWDVEIYSIIMEDFSEFASWDSLGLSEAQERMLGNFFKHTQKIFPSLKRLILSAWAEDICERIAEKI